MQGVQRVTTATLGGAPIGGRIQSYADRLRNSSSWVTETSMRSRLLRVSLVVIGFLASCFVFAAQIEGKVVAVQDGDTITVLDASKKQHRIRFAGIDAPERGQPFGNAAKERLSELVFRQAVIADCYKKDRYRREICRVFRNGADIALEMIRAGYAWHFKRYADEQTPEERARYELAENEARLRKRGLWRDTDPLPPWEWRRGRR